MVDSTLIQIVKFPIPDGKYEDKYDSKKEKKLLNYMFKYEYNYLNNDIYSGKLFSKKEFFSNSYGKQFLLWHFKVPEEFSETSTDFQNNDSTIYHELNAKQQLYLTFVENSSVIMINTTLFNEEKLEDKIQLLKEIANTTRIYAMSININALHWQMKYQQENIPHIINDSASGMVFEIPYWLNIEEGKYHLTATFPDINNISNAILIAMVDENRFDSYSAFMNHMLKDENTISYEKAECENEILDSFKVVFKSSYGEFVGQRVFLHANNTFAYISFTATEDTHEKNIGRLNDFLKSIKYQP
jgi:hypothetical protein